MSCIYFSFGTARTIGESAIHDACSAFNTSQLQSERASFQELVRKTLGRRFDSLWADVTDVQVGSGIIYNRLHTSFSPHVCINHLKLEMVNLFLTSIMYLLDLSESFHVGSKHQTS